MKIVISCVATEKQMHVIDKAYVLCPEMMLGYPSNFLPEETVDLGDTHRLGLLLSLRKDVLRTGYIYSMQNCTILPEFMP